MKGTQGEMINAETFVKNNAHFLLLLLFCLHVTCNFLLLPFKLEKCK